jgi:hypothetical protein
MPATFGKRFYVNVGKDGTFKPSGNQEYDTTAGDIDALFEDLRAQQQKKILLYFHGGLVSANSGMDTAQRIFKYVTNGSTHYPIAFVWETGLFETIGQNIETIGQSDFFKKLLPKILKVAAKQLGLDIPSALGAKGIENLSDEELQAELSKENPFEDYSVNPGKRSTSTVSNFTADSEEENIMIMLVPEIEAELDEQIRSDEELLAAADAEKSPQEAKLMRPGDVAGKAGAKGIFSAVSLVKSAVIITFKVVKRFIQSRDHGFYPTIIEEILREYYVADLGTWVWGRMKYKAQAMWSPDEFSNVDKLKWHSGSYLLKKLVEYQNDNGPLTIDLVGHSAGSIAICELLRAVTDRGIPLKFRNVIFMAPACRAELFHSSFLQKVQAQPDLVRSFRCYTMSDAYETKDRLVPGLYTRSLLYFISGVLEENAFDAYILGLHRHIAAQKPYNTAELVAINAFVSTNSRIVYSVTENGAHDGLRSTSERHGDFDNDQEATLDSMIYMINQQ